MFMRFFTELRQAKVPVTLKEYLMLMEGLDKHVIGRSVEDFYYLSRAALVKDEKNLDKFDRVFGHVFKGLDTPEGENLAAEIPANASAVIVLLEHAWALDVTDAVSTAGGVLYAGGLVSPAALSQVRTELAAVTGAQ